MPIVITHTWKAAHLIWTGYGHWLPNDPRGSGSDRVRSDGLRELGPAHLGRKRVQPPRGELRTFYREAEPKLLHPVVWFGDQQRETIAQATADVVRQRGYTVWALAVLRNHVHAVVRTHRDKSDVMWNAIAGATRVALSESEQTLVPKGHPVWSERPYIVPKRTRAEVIQCIRYVEDNPVKEGLARQQWDCVTRFTG